MKAVRQTISRSLQGLVIVQVVLLVSAGAAWAILKTVDCAKGQTITHALEQSDGNPITIEVRGTCHESVQIERNDVTLVAGSSGGTVDGPDPNTHTINVVGASRIVIDGLTVTGGRNGINGNGANRLTIQNCTVQNTGRTGIAFFQGSSGTVDHCTVQNNLMRHGISIEGGAATVTNSMISDNGRAGILVEPGDPQRLATALAAIWTDDALHATLRADALERAGSGRRTWADVARETRAIYALAGIAGG